MKIRFMQYVKKTADCWEWQGCSLPSGYGRFFFEGKVRLAHRVSACIFKGFNIESSFYVCHHCDNKKCVRPGHLFTGTAKDNRQDASKKGLLPRYFGALNPNSKLSKSDSLYISRMLNEGITVRNLARMFGVSIGPIRQIKQNRHWSQRCV